MQPLNKVVSTHAKFLKGFAVGVVVAAACVAGYIALEGRSRTAYTDTLDSSNKLKRTQESNTLPAGVVVPSEQDSTWKLLKYNAPFDRDAALYAQLTHANKEELLQRLTESKELDSRSQRISTQTTILRRLASIDPRAALDQHALLGSNRTDSMLEGIFYEWSYLDLEDATNGAVQLSAHEKTIAVETILRTRDDLSERTIAQIVRTLEGEDQAAELRTDALVSRLLDEDPRQAWHAATSDTVDDFSQLDLLVRIATTWQETEGFAVLGHLSEALEGYEKSGLLRHITRAVAKSSPRDSLLYAQTLPADTWGGVSGTIAGMWAESDPQDAFSILSEISDGNLRERLQRRIVQTWASSEPRGMLQSIAVLPDDVHQLGIEWAIHSIATHDLDEAIQQMHTMKEYVASTAVIAGSIVSRWSHTDPLAALQWVGSITELDAFERRQLVQEVLTHLVFDDAKQAFEIARDQPVKEGEFEMEIKLISQLVANQKVDVALSVLPMVRSTARLNSFNYVGAGLVLKGRTDEALGLAERLPESEKANYLRIVATSWARDDPLAIVESIESLPSKDARSIAASEVIKRNKRHPVLDADQLEYLASFLNEFHKLSLGY